MQNQE